MCPPRVALTLTDRVAGPRDAFLCLCRECLASLEFPNRELKHIKALGRDGSVKFCGRRRLPEIAQHVGVSQFTRDCRKCIELVELGGGGQEQQKDDVHRLAVNSLEIDGLSEP